MEERNLSWHDWSLARDISRDGERLLMTEYGEAAGAEPGIYLRGMDASPAARLGTGSALALSPDALRVLAIRRGRLLLLPVGAGEPLTLPHAALAYEPWAAFLPDGRGFVFTGGEPGRARRVYVQGLPDGRAVPITPEEFRVASPGAVSPSADLVAVVGNDERLFLSSVSGGVPRPIPGATRGEVVAQWDRGGRAVFVVAPQQIPAHVFRLSLDGHREPMETLSPPDRVGAVSIIRLVMTPGGEAYAYTLERQLSDLYVATGLPDRARASRRAVLRSMMSLMPWAGW